MLLERGECQVVIDISLVPNLKNWQEGKDMDQKHILKECQEGIEVDLVHTLRVGPRGKMYIVQY